MPAYAPKRFPNTLKPPHRFPFCTNTQPFDTHRNSYVLCFGFFLLVSPWAYSSVMQRSILILTLIAVSESKAPKLSVLHALVRTPQPLKTNLLLTEARRLDPSTTVDDVENAQKIVVPHICAPNWFHETMIAASMVDASEEENLRSLVERGRSEGKIGAQYDEPQLRSRMQTWKTFCIDRGACKPFAKNEYWILHPPAIVSFVKSMIIKHTPHGGTLSTPKRHMIGKFVKSNLNATPLQLAEKFNVHPAEAWSAYHSVIGIFRQPQWFLKLLQSIENKAELSPDNRTLLEKIRRLNLSNKTKTNGVLGHALRAWLRIVVSDTENGNKKYFREFELVDGETHEYVRITREAMVNYLTNSGDRSEPSQQSL
jgi:hypothetical protein